MHIFFFCNFPGLVSIFGILIICFAGKEVLCFDLLAYERSGKHRRMFRTNLMILQNVRYCEYPEYD